MNVSRATRTYFFLDSTSEDERVSSLGPSRSPSSVASSHGDGTRPGFVPVCRFTSCRMVVPLFFLSPATRQQIAVVPFSRPHRRLAYSRTIHVARTPRVLRCPSHPLYESDFNLSANRNNSRLFADRRRLRLKNFNNFRSIFPSRTSWELHPGVSCRNRAGLLNLLNLINSLIEYKRHLMR